MQENLEPIKCTIINDKRGKKKRKSTSQEESEELEKLRNAVTSLQESENKLKQIFLNAVKDIQQKKLDQIKVKFYKVFIAKGNIRFVVASQTKMSPMQNNERKINKS